MSCDPTWLPAQLYATEDDLLCECKTVDTSGAAFQWALQMATRRVYEVTNGLFPGCFTTKIRPCRRLCRTLNERISTDDLLRRPHPLFPAMPYLIDGGPAPILANLWACDCGGDPCSCGHRDWIVLPYRPVQEVVEVKLDGVVFTDWQLVGAKLFRTDDKPWPTCNAMEPDTEPGTWSVTEVHGTPLPPEGAPLIAAYACELAKRACKKPCDLPDGIRVVSRAGVEFAVVDTKYRDQNLTGFTQLDDWLVGLLGGLKRSREAPRMWTRRRAERARARVESIKPMTSNVAPDGVMHETLHVRSNEGLQKTVSYPGQDIEAGRLTISIDDVQWIVELATVTDGEALFEIPADSWPDPFPADDTTGGEWDLIVKIVGGDWEAVVGGPVRFHEGVSEPVF